MNHAYGKHRRFKANAANHFASFFFADCVEVFPFEFKVQPFRCCWMRIFRYYYHCVFSWNCVRARCQPHEHSKQTAANTTTNNNNNRSFGTVSTIDLISFRVLWFAANGRLSSSIARARPRLVTINRYNRTFMIELNVGYRAQCVVHTQ